MVIITPPSGCLFLLPLPVAALLYLVSEELLVEAHVDGKYGN